MNRRIIFGLVALVLISILLCACDELSLVTSSLEKNPPIESINPSPLSNQDVQTSGQDLAAEAALKFWNPSDAITIVAIAGAESDGWKADIGGDSPRILSSLGFTDTAVLARGYNYPAGSEDGYASWGLWQIFMPVHKTTLENLGAPKNDPCGTAEWLKNPENNARAAYEIWKLQGFDAWSTYKNGKYNDYVQRAEDAIKKTISTTPAQISSPIPASSSASATARITTMTPTQTLVVTPSTTLSCTLTLYVHENDVNGPLVSGVQVTGQDGSGKSFTQITNSSGYINFSGTAGTWSITISKSGYQARTSSLHVTQTSNENTYIKKDSPVSKTLSNSELVALVTLHFQDGVVSQTGESIRVTAYAVAKAESGANVSAAGDNGDSIGLWQINLPAHPEYNKDRLFDPDYNAEAARQISSNGVNWKPWSTWNNSSYLQWLDEARALFGKKAPTTGLTMPVPLSPGEPVANGHTAIAYNSVTFIWTKNNTGATYALYIRDITGYDDNAGTDVGTLVVNGINIGDTDTYVWKGAASDKKYRWQVEAVKNGTTSLSDKLVFTTQAPIVVAPQITGIGPSTPTVNPAKQYLTLLGSGFVSNSQVILRIGGSEYPIPSDRTVFYSSSQIQVYVGLTESGTWTVQITNPGGSQSNIYSFRVQALQVNYNLSVTNQGQGLVVLGPSGGSYASGTQVTLTATASDGWQFSSWNGDLTSSQNPVTITMTSNKSITAVFSQQTVLPSTPTALSPGIGAEPGQTVSGLTPTLSWSDSQSAEYYSVSISIYPYGTSNIVYSISNIHGISYQVPAGCLNAGQKYRWNLRAWNSDGASDYSNTLYFQTQTQAVTCTLTTGVQGQGSVSLNPSGGTYISGTQVTLTATPSSGWQFSKWSGDLSGSQTSITITVISNKNITATFIQSATRPNPPSLALAGTGNGYVDISWTVSSNGGSPITSYKIYRGYSPGSESYFTSTTPDWTTFHNTTVVNGTAYYYKVTSVNAVGESSFSNEVIGTPTSPMTITLGSSVRATANVNCRSSPTTSGSNVIKTMSRGNTGIVIGGPASVDSYVWWQIRWSDGTTGWSVQDYIAKS